VLPLLLGAPDPSGPVWGVTMARNEEHRIAGSVRQLLDGGVDAVVVADNLSTDGTRDVLDELARDVPLIVVDDREEAYYQGPKMSLLARAAARCGASWIVPFDADELWYGVGAPLATRLRALDGDAAIAPMFDFLPRPDQHVVDDPYRALTTRRRQPGTQKIAFRAHLLASIGTGNHWVMQPVRTVHGAVSIRHYPFLGFDHFVEKARIGNAALAATDLPSEVGAHWRAWGESDDHGLARAWRDLTDDDLVDDPLPDRAFVDEAPPTS
jgi:glycosyltransferase involved in cell wall biosynthesis